MCSAIPPAPPPVAPPPQASAPVVLGVVADKGTAEALAKLQAGAVLAATMAGSEGKGPDSRGIVRVMTADGSSLSLRLPPGQTLPPDGAQLAMQYISQNGLPAFKLLAINGRPTGAAPLPLPQGGLLNPTDLAGLLGSGAKAAAAQVPGPAMGPGGAPVVTSPGLAAGPVGLTATIIRSGPPGAVMLPADAGTPGLEMTEPLPASLTGLAPGTRLTVRIAAMAPPAQGMVSGGQPVPGATRQASAAAQAAQSAQPVQAALPQTPLPPSALGAPLAPHSATPSPQVPGQPPIVAGPPAFTVAAPLPQPQSVTLPGLVVAQPSGGAALVQSPAGMLSLNVASPLPVGGVLRLEVIDRPLPPLPASPAPAPPQGLTPGGWPSLDQAVDTLLQTDRQAAQQLMRMIPQAGPYLAAALSQFAGAVRSGDARPLLSDPVVKGLEKAGRKDLAEKLKKEFLDLAEDASRPMGRGDWQAITLPFAHGANIDAIDLYIHRPPNDEEKGAKGSEQRFILDVRMSVLGRIQLDGLVQKDLKRFDLIVRSTEPLSAAMCRDISGIFAECGQMTGIKGQVSFQAGRPFVDLLPVAAPATQIVV